jgi:hypothetical protein
MISVYTDLDLTYVELIRIGLRERKWEGVDCMHLAQVRGQWRALVKKEMNLRVP